ncbi:MAG: carbamoyltransferase [Actinomycetota bacterium]
MASIVLGVTVGHDGSVAVVKDGRLVAAISRERLTRRKKDHGVTKAEVDYVLDLAGARLEDVACVAFATYTFAPDNFLKVYDMAGQEIRRNLWDHPPGRYVEEVKVKLGQHATRGVWVQHHLSHCASAFYTSPFERSAVFSVDSSMIRPEVCSLYAYGDGSQMFPLYCPGVMIGNAYHQFTRKLGLGDGLFKAGTTMGLASYGTPLPLAVEKWRDYGRSWYERPEQPDDLRHIDLMWSELAQVAPHVEFSHEESDTRRAMDLAASLQYVFEETIVAAAQELHRRTAHYSDGKLCLAGGSFLNCNTNSAILARTPFDDVHLFPGCGDDGNAVGSALFVAHHVMKQPRPRYEPQDVAYLGRSYPTPDVGRPLDLDEVAGAIAAGKVVGWFQGRAEFGPRALGNRSILADPRNPDMRDHINFKVKRREWFRPFAPMVRAEAAADWFEFDRPSPFMLFTAKVRRPEALPAISHVDGSARLQTVTATSNPRIYDLLGRFQALTGMPVLLNTSLNVNGEPLVETPEDALRFWDTTPADLMVVGDRMLVR